MALKRPVGTLWEKVASVNRKDGTFFRFYENYHHGLYVNRVTADADLQAMELFLRLTNFTSKMENIYCIKYEMSGKDDINTCVSQALILRDAGEYISVMKLRCNFVSRAFLLKFDREGTGKVEWVGLTDCSGPPFSQLSPLRRLGGRLALV